MFPERREAVLHLRFLIMVKRNLISVKDVTIRTIQKEGVDYISQTDIARQKNETEPKDVVKKLASPEEYA